MKKALYLVAFLAGAAVGALGVTTYIKKHYDISEKTDEQEDDGIVVAAEEVDEKEEAIRRTNEAILKTVKDPAEKAAAATLLNKYFTKASVYGSDEEEDEEPGEPYVILEDAYGEYADYSTVELVYYADGVLADDRDEKIDNAEELLGKDFASKFGDKDEIFIRNDAMCSDYNVLRDLGNYDDFEADRPHIHMEE